MLEESWGLQRDALKLHRKKIDEIVLSRAKELPEAPATTAAPAAASGLDALPPPWNSRPFLESTIGHRLKLWWDGDDCYFNGKVIKVNSKHQVRAPPRPRH